MESLWQQKINRSLRKERTLGVKRTVHILPRNQTREEFMERHLAQLKDDGVGKFSSLCKKGADRIHWRCERSNKCRGKSTGDPATTKANGCGAYVSFSFADKNAFSSCVVRLMDRHSGHPHEQCSSSDWIVADVIAHAVAAHQVVDSNEGAVAIHHHQLGDPNVDAVAIQLEGSNEDVAMAIHQLGDANEDAVAAHQLADSNEDAKDIHQLGDSNEEMSTEHVPSTAATCTTSEEIYAVVVATDNTAANATTSQTTTTATTALALPDPSTHDHLTAARPSTSAPTVFKEIAMVLPCLSAGKKRRCNITVEELARRVGPPEHMSLATLVGYLRTDNNKRKELKEQLLAAGIKPSSHTTQTSMFSQLCEEEVDALCKSLDGLVQSHLPFEEVYVIPEGEDVEMTLGRLLVFKSNLRGAIEAIKDKAQAVDLVSHGFMSKMLDITLSVFDTCIDNQITSLKHMF